jgi:hypothetical protein
MSHKTNICNLAAGLMPDNKAILPLCETFFFFASLVLCTWTHPNYYHTRLARSLRVPLSIVSVIWWLCYPFTFLKEPRSTNVAANIGPCLLTFLMMSKCLDWGLFSGPQTRRKYIRRSDIASGEWVPAERNSKPQPPHKTLLAHVFMQLTS